MIAKHTARWSAAALTVPLLLTALAYAMRTYRLGVQSLWLDEGLSVVFGRLPLPELLPKVITADIHPPFYIVALHYWMQVAGEGEYAVRFLSAAFGVLLVPVVYRLGVDLFARPGEDEREARLTGLIAAALVAVSPFLLYYSQEARNYIVVTFWSALSCLALWRALGGGGRRWWAGYVVASALVIYTHYYGGFVLGAQAAYLALTWRRQRGQLRTWLGSVAAIAVLYLPWAVGLYGQARNLWLHPDYWAGSIDLGTIVLRTFASFTFGSAQAMGGGGLILALFAVLFAGGAAVLVVRGGVRSGRGELYLLFYTLVPLAAVYAISARNPKFAERYLIIITPAFYLVLARALAAAYGLGQRLRARWTPFAGTGATACLVGTALAVALSTSGAWRVYFGPEWAKDDYRDAIALIEAQSRPGDVIVLTRNAYQPMQYYYHGDLPWKGLDPAGPNAPPDIANVADRLNGIVRGHTRVWLLLWQEDVVDPTRLVAGLLRKYGRQVPVDATFSGVKVELYELPPDTVLAAAPQHDLAVGYENGLSLDGYDLAADQLEPGQTIDLSLYWHLTRSLQQSVGLSLALRDERGLVWASEGHRLSGEYLLPTRWRVGASVRGETPLTVPPGTPPGRYTVELNVHEADSLRELSRVMPSGQPVGTRYALAQVQVLPAAGSAPTATQLGVAHALETGLGSAGGEVLRLLGTGDLPATLAQGGTADLSLYWEKVAANAGDHEAIVELVGGETRAIVRWPLTPGYATSAWRQGERLRGQYRLLVPANLPAGEYAVRLAVVSAGSEERLRTAAGETSVALGQLRVTGPERVLAPPPVGTRQEVSFGAVAALYGFDVKTNGAPAAEVRPGDSLDVTLVWRALAAMDTPYTVFVHLADATQRPWAQHDGQPAGGARPTTSWIAGEYVEDTHKVTISPEVPPGHYRLLVGLYGPDGKRLPLDAGPSQPAGNAAVLAGVDIEVVK